LTVRDDEEEEERVDEEEEEGFNAFLALVSPLDTLLETVEVVEGYPFLGGRPILRTVTTVP